MIPEVNIGDLIQYGGVYKDIAGSTTDEVYKDICNKISLPETLSAEQLFDALSKREKILSTAVGNGIAIPHARTPLLKEFVDQRIAICYLKNPIDMQSPDSKKVFVMFVVLTSNPQSHLQVISRLAALLKNAKFRQALEKQACLEEILDHVNNL